MNCLTHILNIDISLRKPTEIIVIEQTVHLVKINKNYTFSILF